MGRRGADDAFIDAAERQVHTAMHRRTVNELLSLLDQARFQGVEQPFHAVHTVMLLARK